MNAELVWKILPWVCKAARLFTGRKPKPVTFLIVEDNADDAEVLQYQLKKRGISCEVATSAETAQGLVRHTFYPVVFVDLRLPGMSGAALLRILSREAPNTNTVVVCGEPYDLKDIPASRFISVIRKPATLDAIEEMLTKLKV